MRCRKFVIAVLLCSLGWSGAKAQQAEVLKLTLNDALKIALSENPTIKVADQEITKSEYAKKGTYAALFPTVEASGIYQRTLQKQTMYMSSTEISIGTDNTWQAGVSASMPIVNAALWKSLKISAMDVELAVEQASSSRIDLVEQVSNAFYGVLLASDSYELFKDVYDNAVENYNNVKQKYDVGTTSEYELITADVAVKNAEPDMYDAENAIVLCEWQLKALLGVELDIQIDCEGSLSDYTNFIQPNKNTLNISNNSAIKQMEIQGRQLTKALEVSRAADLPTLALTFSYNYSAMSDDFKFRNYSWNPYSVAGLSLSIPIFAGGKRRSDISQAKINISQFNLEKENTERTLNVALTQAINNINTYIKQYAAASSNVEQAQKGYDIAVRRYEIGNGTQLEVNNSQLALTQARIYLNQAVYNYMVAQASLNSITGKSTSQYEN